MADEKPESKLDAADVGIIIWFVATVGLLWFIWVEVSDLKRQVLEFRPKQTVGEHRDAWFGPSWYIQRPHCTVYEKCENTWGDKK